MLGLGSKKAGLSIEQNGVRYIQLKNNKTWEIEKQSFLPLNPGTIIENQIADEEGLREQIRQWAEQEGLKGSRIALSVPPSQVIIRKMSIPALQPKQVQQLVELEVETGLHLPFEEPVYDYIPIGQDKQIQEDGREEAVTRVLVFAAPRRLITEYVDILTGAGIKTESVEVSATALSRMAEAAQEQPFNDTMLVHLEHAQLDVYMFREGHPVFMRTISLLDMDQETPLFESESYLAQKSTLGSEQLLPEQLVEVTAEISRMLNFYQYSLHDGAAQINELVVTGAESSRRQLVDELRQALTEMDIRELQLESPPGKQEDASLNRYRVAVGAALLDDKNRLIDLMPREDREAKVLPYALGVLMLIWLLAAAGLSIFYVSQKNELESQNTQIIQLQNDRDVKQLELAAIQGEGNSPGQRIRDWEAARTDAVSVLEQLDAALPKGSVIRDISYAQDDAIDLTVSFTGVEQASFYLTNLKALPFTVAADISSLARQSDSQAGGGRGAIALYSGVYRVALNSDSTDGAAADSVRSIGEKIAPDAASNDLNTQEESVNDGTTP